MVGFHKILNSKSKTFLTFCFSFILGVAIFSFANTNKSAFILYLLLFIILFLLIIFYHDKTKRVIILCLLLFVLGGLRFLITIPSHNSSTVEYYNGRKVSLRGWVSVEPDIGISDVRYVVSVESLESTHVSGKIAVKTLLYPQYKYGDELEIKCSLLEPEKFIDSNFNYPKYLAKQGIWSICANPIINDAGGDKGNFFMKKMLWLKSETQSQMSKLWPEPDSSLMAGVLYGSRSGMPQDLIDNFTRTGVSHIVAVSGYNVSIIVMVLNVFLIYVGLSRKQSFWFLISLIFSFVFFTGATASVVRAGVMAGVVLFAQYVGRMSSAGRVLLYAAVIMLLFNPYVLIWDAGFQLSFLSTLGLVYLSPILEKIDLPLAQALKSGVMAPPLFLRIGWGEVIWQVLITTISAIIATLPMILFQFGRLSLVASLVNILILWIIPWLMLFGFISLIFSFIFYPLGQVVAWVAGLGLKYVIIIVDWFGDKSWSAVDVRIPIWVMVGMYTFIAFLVIKNLYGKKSKSSLV